MRGEFFHNECEKVFSCHLNPNQQERSSAGQDETVLTCVEERWVDTTHIRQETSRGNENGEAFETNFICTLLKEIPVGEKTERVQHDKAFG